MGSNKRTANAAGAKTARACESCVRRRARWYCAADDAFLCQSCDSSVHSANPLAGRHSRIRLNSDDKPPIPSWPRGVTTKPRTPRHPKQSNHLTIKAESLVVPDQLDDHQEDDLYRVPEMDVEMLMWKGIEGEIRDGIEELGLLDLHHEFDFCVPVLKPENQVLIGEDGDDKGEIKGRLWLQLDYDGVAVEWGSKGSPWVNGGRPDEINLTMGEEEEGERGKKGGREERVWRYREKRRRRLLNSNSNSNKIRYEVRKFNAEKRPRLKGRFVKLPLI